MREALAAGPGVVQEPELGEDTRIAHAQIEDADLQATELIVCLEERRASPVMRRLAKLIGEVGR